MGDRCGSSTAAKHLRASRTGGIALREQIRAGGLSLTANTQRGARVSMTPARNTQVAFQNSRFVLRGRYGKGPAKLNLSKSGVSLSAKMGLGTINVTNPGRSSAKIAGVQMRGQKAAAINAVVALFQMLVVLVRVAFTLIVYLVVGTLNGAIWLYETSQALIAQWRFNRQQKKRAERTRRLEEAASQWLASNGDLLEEMAPESCLAAMEKLLVRTGVGADAAARQQEDENARQGPEVDGRTRQLVERLSLVDGPQSANDDAGSAALPVTGIAVLAIHYRDSAPTEELPRAFYQFDDTTLANGPRTIGQELLLEDIADLFGLRLEAEEEVETDP
ncbi:MAG: hypothetical protein U5L08_07955 [Xanthomonadales bacterium]|nr:hypothetical protein [Xanthomonadales bacterium]